MKGFLFMFTFILQCSHHTLVS